MPPAIHPSIASLLAIRQDIATSSLGDNSTSPPPTPPGLDIVCAWPVSGQYGFGTRILYYLLIAACVIARKFKWLRNACLAAALLFPVTAAIHGIVLAAAHNANAVDMDIYGALQLCAIGVLVAPVSVRLSKTYNKSEGRNLIFAWSAILLAGLISLVVEFYRSISNKHHCEENYNGHPMTSPSQFPYNDTSFTCDLVCDVTWPHSPIRLGSSNNIYLVPAPTVMTFEVATLIAAGACIPAILLPASILRQNYKEKSLVLPLEEAHSRETLHELSSSGAEHIERVSETESDSDGSRTATESPAGTRADANYEKLRKALQKWPLGIIFVVIVIAMLGFGETNLWSHQVYYQTDYMANVGQWAPLVGSGFAIFGSGYLLLTEAMDVERKKLERRESGHDPEDRGQQAEDTIPEDQARGQLRRILSSGVKSRVATTTTLAAPMQTNDVGEGTGSRGLQFVARQLVKVNDTLSNWMDSSLRNIRGGLKSAQMQYPETPGEHLKNSKLAKIRTLNTSRRLSHESHMSGASIGGRQRSDTVTSNASQQGRGRSSSDIQPGTQKRRDTLEVPAQRRSTQSSLPAHPAQAHLPAPNRPDYPEIVVSGEPT